MVSIDEITDNINKALGEDGAATPEGDENTHIPKSVCSDSRPDRTYVACYSTSGALSGNPNGSPGNQAFEMFHWTALRCPDITVAISAVIGFELSEMRFAPNGASELNVDVDEAIESGKASVKRNTCSTYGNAHEVLVKIQRSENDTRYISLFESTEMLRQLFASMMTDGENMGHGENEAQTRSSGGFVEVVDGES